MEKETEKESIPKMEKGRGLMATAIPTISVGGGDRANPLLIPAGNDAGCPGKATPQLRGAPPAPRAGWRMDHKLLPGVQGEAEVQEESQGPSSVGHGVSRHSLRRATRILVLRAMVEDLQKEMQCRRMSEIEKM
eukprot:RCo017939